MRNIWERMADTMKQDLAKLKGTTEDITKRAGEKRRKADSLQKRIADQREEADRLRKRRDQALVQAADRRRQQKLAEEADEMELADFAKRDAEAYDQEAETLAAMTKDADARMLELEQMFQEVRHALTRQELEEQELKRREATAQLRSEMSGLKEAEPTNVEQEPSSEDIRSSMERQLMLLEKRHGERKNPSDFLET
ncbi:hypothetical protein [Alkalicoccus luteus]|uniref:PspA/IM30 family protein n=1 Tax=Alkalicoccus luteus TaxID=1237094 RepID=A0A969TVV9_9BACI|nr:hypothetical protein [Alkalicoccus luteus]NJP36744.1 hypothetical protein [Alkalicoccus luteus]